MAAIRIERRPAAIAVIVGVVLGIAQTAPMMQLPLYFQLVLRYGPLLAVVALAPLFGALILAGPAAGFLLARYSPRQLVGVGAIAVGLGDLLLALVTSRRRPATSLFVVPCFLVGAGFVIATTVRTAIIFASVPRGLPATAAALNEASISVGARIGIVLVTAIVAKVALAAYTATVAGLPAADAQQAIAAFRDVLIAVGTPSFSQVTSAVSAADVQPYVDAYAAGVRAALALGGLVAVGRAGWSRGSRSAVVTRSRPCTSIATSERRSRAERLGPGTTDVKPTCSAAGPGAAGYSAVVAPVKRQDPIRTAGTRTAPSSPRSRRRSVATASTAASASR